jgi:hypothetical protein
MGPSAEEYLRAQIAKGRRVIEQAASDAADDLRKQLSVPAAVGGDGFAFDISSSPGEFPRMRSGELRGSVYHRITENQGTRIYFEVGCTAPHSKFLEHGTSRMAARPHLEPTRRKWNEILRQRLSAAFRR